MRSLMLALGAAAMVAPTLIVPVQASAQRYDRYDRDRDYRGDRDYRRDRGYTRCTRSGGTTGAVVGGVGGALLGRTIDTRGDRTLGTVLGAGAGALAGRAIERDGNKRCR